MEHPILDNPHFNSLYKIQIYVLNHAKLLDAGPEKFGLSSHLGTTQTNENWNLW
jgi:hypothetical protein